MTWHAEEGLIGGDATVTPEEFLTVPTYVREAFDAFKAKHGRIYEGEEHDYRLGIFHENLKFIENFYKGPEQTFQVGVGPMADLTNEEFKQMYTMSNGFPIKPESEKNYVDLPDSSFEQTGGVDWRTKGIVNPVKNQESCGSCWAFSAVAAMEGAYAQKHGSLKSFSEQQLVDCSKKQGNHGCQGGLMDFAFKYAETNKMETESEYPYTGRDGTTCKYNMAEGVMNTASYKDVTPRSPTQLMAAIDIGVVSIAIEADKSIFQHYRSGVINSPACGTKLDHGVAVVGYTSDSFIVRNSWGPTWGD